MRHGISTSKCARRWHGALSLLAVGLAAMTGLAASAPARAPANEAPYVTLAAFALDPCVDGLLGDVTADGASNVIDAQQVARASAGLSVSGTVSGRLATHGDITGDGNTNVIDAQQIARYSAALAVAFPIGEPMCGITVNTSSTGGGIDPDGYDVRLDGAFAGTVAATGSLDLEQLAIGDYTVGLEGIATNCSITNGAASRNVSVVAGVVASVTFELACLSNVGAIRVQNDTEGPKPGTNYTVTLDGSDTRDMVPGDGADSAVLFENVSVGAHTVTIGNIPGNCTVSGTASKDFTVTEGSLEQHQWVVTCT